MDDTAPMPIVAARQGAPSGTLRPLVVDLDGSLVRTDTMLICIVSLGRRPITLLRALLALRHGKARLKEELAAAADLDAALLPYHQALLSYLQEQRAAGRRLVLATGADRRIAEAVARHLGLFDGVLASDGRTNLTRSAKLAAIRDTLGDAPFTYVGNSRADLAVWCEAASGVCVNVRPPVARAAAQTTVIERAFAGDKWPVALLSAIRSRQ
jgi:phosphoglycolate phosphatase-like HAD superfamily hydrolase